MLLSEIIVRNLCIKLTLHDYGLKFKNILIYCYKTNAINLSKNPIKHSKAKHIYIRHHLLKVRFQKGDISLESASTENQLADLLNHYLLNDLQG